MVVSRSRVLTFIQRGASGALTPRSRSSLARFRQSNTYALLFRDFLVGIELRSPPGDFLGGELLDVAKVKLPVRIVAPPQRRLHGGARTARGFQYFQSQFHGERLGINVVRPAGGIPQGEVAEQEAWHTAELHQILGTAH